MYISQLRIIVFYVKRIYKETGSINYLIEYLIEHDIWQLMDEIIYPILKLTNPRIRYVISSLISSNIMYIKSSNTIELHGMWTTITLRRNIEVI